MTSSRVPPSASPGRRRGFRSGLAGLCLSLAMAGPLSAQSGHSISSGFAEQLSTSPDTWVVAPDGARYGASSASGSISGLPLKQVSQQRAIEGFGINGRLGHITGPAVGHRESFTYIELSPFTTYENTWFSGDFRLLRPNTGHLGSSSGAVLRQYLPRFNSILGVNAFYDIDDTRGRKYEQFGLGFELLTEWLDIRSNIYLPQGSQTGVINTGIVRNSGRFEGNNLFFSDFTTSATSADGFDLLFTVPVPGRVAESVNLEASAGYYHFETDNDLLSTVNGWKLRVDGSGLNHMLHMYMELTGDEVFDRNVVFGFDINYFRQGDTGPRIRGNQHNRLSKWVERNWTVVTVDDTVINTGNLAINPATGNPYFIEHVDSQGRATDATAALGTFENPYLTIQDAQTNLPGPPDPATMLDNIIFAHAGSSFNVPIVMQPNERILGEGPIHTIPVQGFRDPLQLPSTGKTGGFPELTGIVGVPVTLSNDVTFAGFQINNTTGGPAILANGTTGTVTVYDVLINGVTGGSGVIVDGAFGTVNFNRIDISNAEGDALIIRNGNATVNFREGTINNSQARSVRIEDFDGVFNLSGTSINDSGEGIIVDNFTGTGTFNSANITNGTVDLLDVSGTIAWLNDLEINNSVPNAENPDGYAFHVNNMSGAVNFGTNADITINGRANTGIQLDNVSGNFRSLASTTIATTNATGLTTPGVNFINSSGSVRFGSLTVNGGNAAVLIGDPLGVNTNTGSALFEIGGQFNLSNTTDPDLGAISVFDNAAVTTNGGSITNRFGNGILVEGTTGTLNFGGLTTIANTPLNGNAGIDVSDATGFVQFGSVSVNQARFPEPAVWIRDSGDISFASLSVDDYLGSTALGEFAVDIHDNASVSINGGTIEATLAGGIRLSDNDLIGVSLTSVSATNDTLGILVEAPSDTDGVLGSFTVTGTGSPGSGGVISGMAEVGADFHYENMDQLQSANFVSLNFMNLTGNGMGVHTVNVNGVGLGTVNIAQSLFEGALIEDAVSFVLLNSTFLNNGVSGTAGRREHVDLVVNNAPANTVFNYSITRSTFTDSATITGSPMVNVRTGGGGAGAILNLLVEDNGTPGAPGSSTPGFLGRRTDAAALQVTWNGEIRQATIQRNVVQFAAGQDQTGYSIINTSTAESNVLFQQNQFISSTGTGNIGALFDFGGQADLNILENRVFDSTGVARAGFLMNGTANRGYSITFGAGGSNLNMQNNQVDFAANTNDGIGVEFPFTNGAQTFVIAGNTINFLGNNDAFISPAPGERGFVFGPVVGTIDFSGTGNFVNFTAPDIFSNPVELPAGTFTGGFEVNGVFYP